MCYQQKDMRSFPEVKPGQDRVLRSEGVKRANQDSNTLRNRPEKESQSAGPPRYYANKTVETYRTVSNSQASRLRLRQRPDGLPVRMSMESIAEEVEQAPNSAEEEQPEVGQATQVEETLRRSARLKEKDQREKQE